MRVSKKLDLEPERLELEDGDFVDLLWSKKQSGSIVAVFHGLAGNIDSAYANGIVAALETAGFRPVFLVFRGCSDEPNRLAKTYHSGHTEDIRALLQLLRSRFPGIPLHAIGYSLGANSLLKYLGELTNGEAIDTPLTSAIAVSPPLVLKEGANRMKNGLSRIYQDYLVSQLRLSHNRKRAHRPELMLEEATSGHRTFWDFDDAFTAPLNGFSGVDEYYEICSARQYLASIRTRCHIIFSRDDPFFTPAVIPQESELSDQVTFELSERGGHVGYIEGALPFRASYWLDQRIIELLKRE